MKKLPILLILCLLSVLIIAGCSQSSNTDNAQGGSSNNQEESSNENTDNTSNTNSEEKEASNDTKFPEKSIELLIIVGPGGSVDTTARVLAEEVSKHLPNNQKVVPVNRPGGSGTVALTALNNSKKDGYTIAIAGPGQIVTQPLLGTAPYTPEDFEYILNVVAAPNYAVDRVDSPWSTPEEWVEYVKNNPGEVKIGVVGKTASTPLALEKFRVETGLDFVTVPYDGSGPALAALLAGEIDMGAFSQSTIDGVDEVRKLFAITPDRTKSAPEVPSINEFSGLDSTLGTWTPLGIVAPKGVPEAEIKILHDALKAALEEQTVIDKLDQIGIETSYQNGEQYKQAIDDEYVMTEEMLKQIGLIE